MCSLPRFLIALIAALMMTTQSFGRGGNMRSEDRYESQHISNLPPHVRQAVLRLCRGARALHDFSIYTDHLQVIVLHFERLYCEQTSFCKPSGCLHQTYISSHGHYRLVESHYAGEGN